MEKMGFNCYCYGHHVYTAIWRPIRVTALWRERKRTRFFFFVGIFFIFFFFFVWGGGFCGALMNTPETITSSSEVVQRLAESLTKSPCVCVRGVCVCVVSQVNHSISLSLSVLNNSFDIVALDRVIFLNG